MKKFIAIILCLCLALSLFAGCSQSKGTEEESSDITLLTRDDWNDRVKTAVNDFVTLYGNTSDSYSEDSYVVFDFDNTTAIFDMEEMTLYHQIASMCFAIQPDNMKEILATGLECTGNELTEYGYTGTEQSLIDDVASAYSYLWDNYGPFTAEGLDDAAQEEIRADSYWTEFAVKLSALYDVIGDVEGADIAYPWIGYLFTGMNEDEIYNIAYNCLEIYKGVETKTVTITSPETVESESGVYEYTWTVGVTVTDNMKELWKTLDDNGIDVWVCSASFTGVIKAAIDVFNLHDYCTGMVAMTNKTDENGYYINEYDYTDGCGFYAGENGAWEKMTNPTETQTQAEGKVTAIVNAIAPDYNNCGPLAGFMDSKGDFNFCTEFDSLKLVVCFNTANRSVCDGGSLIAELAIYQEDNLGLDLKAANDKGDTLYVLQGRDENGLRTFRNSAETIRFGETEEKLFRDEENEALLAYFADNEMTAAEILNTFCIYTPADDESNLTGFDYGWLETYSGYHSK